MTQTTRITAAREAFFPVTFADGFTGRFVTKGEFEKVLEAHFGKVFVEETEEENNRYRIPPDRRDECLRIRNHYFEALHTDYLLLQDQDGSPLGWFYGEQQDFESFYLRNAGLFPQVRRAGFASQFLTHYLEYLVACGYEQVTSQHSPTNRAVLILMLKAGFFISGMTLTERWGPLVSMVYHFPEDRRRFYALKFGALDHLSQRRG